MKRKIALLLAAVSVVLVLLTAGDLSGNILTEVLQPMTHGAGG